MTSANMPPEDSAPTELETEESFVPVFSSSNTDGEMEAMTIQGVLDSNDIPNMLVGPHMIPTLEFQIHVPEHLAAQAVELIEAARLAGPAAAEEAEAASEL